MTHPAFLFYPQLNLLEIHVKDVGREIRDEVLGEGLVPLVTLRQLRGISVPRVIDAIRLETPTLLHPCTRMPVYRIMNIDGPPKKTIQTMIRPFLSFPPWILFSLFGLGGKILLRNTLIDQLHENSPPGNKRRRILEGFRKIHLYAPNKTFREYV